MTAPSITSEEIARTIAAGVDRPAAFAGFSQLVDDPALLDRCMAAWEADEVEEQTQEGSSGWMRTRVMLAAAGFPQPLDPPHHFLTARVATRTEFDDLKDDLTLPGMIAVEDVALMHEILERDPIGDGILREVAALGGRREDGVFIVDGHGRLEAIAAEVRARLAGREELPLLALRDIEPPPVLPSQADEGGITLEVDRALSYDGRVMKRSGSRRPRSSQPPIVRAAPKQERNAPCHCGSGKKWKKCHGDNSLPRLHPEMMAALGPLAPEDK